MAKKTITLKPHFNKSGNVNGWEVGDGKNVAINRSKTDGEKAWARSIREHVEAGYTVEAKAYDRDDDLVAHGTYKANGDVIDHGPKKKKPAAKKAAPKKSSTRKPAARKPAAKKPAARKPAAKKAAPKKRTPAKRAPAKKRTSSAGKKKLPPALKRYQTYAKKRIPQLKNQGYSHKEAQKICGAEFKAGKR